MFTGIIEEIGTVESTINDTLSSKITIRAKKIFKGLKLGDSISTNGVCLTVTKFTSTNFTVDVMPETIRRTNLKNLKKGSKINLERALKLESRLGGHIVSGHIDGVGIIKSYKKENNATWVSIEVPDEILKYIVYKGSIAVDGTSLTVAYVDDRIFKVSIIPMTRDETIILTKKIGDEVNIECDVIGKYIEKLMQFKINNKNYGNKKSIDMKFLKDNNFL